MSILDPENSDGWPRAARPAPTDENALEQRLVDLIRANGPITVADYMTDALAHPQYGYYTARQAIGAKGDFITAPEISQMFGELIGAWLIDSWIAMGAPEAVNLVELGPGRGVLMADILRTARLRPDFVEAARIQLVETSGRMRYEQERRLRDISSKVEWLDDFSQVQRGPALIVANEFFDCQPVHQYVRTRSGWRERLVGLDETGTKLAFTLSGVNARPPEAPDWIDQAETGEIFEVSLELLDTAREVAAHLAQNRGRALIIDYGHARAGLGETLQGVRRHAYWPPLSTPGRADLTAHVDFSALARTGLEAGLGVYGPAPQGQFLHQLGLGARADRLKEKSGPAEAAEIDAAARRLAAPDQMGELFKALAYSSLDLSQPPGFAQA